jgi:protease-4
MRKVIIAILIGLLLIVIAFMLGVCASLFEKRSIYGEHVGIVKIEGAIVTSGEAVEMLEDARKDSNIKAVVLRVDSPGGAVAASQEIYEEVKNVNAVKPVVASMGDVAASGGYYVSLGARRIFANPGTITGSIGVRMEHLNLKDLLSLARVGHETLKSGEYKDMGSINRELTPAERGILQGLLAELHAQFKEAVMEGRRLPAEAVENIADGRIYSGEQAKALGLIDELGGQTLAVKAAASMAGIKGEPKVIEIEPARTWWEDVLENSVKGAVERIIGGAAGFSLR